MFFHLGVILGLFRNLFLNALSGHGLNFLLSCQKKVTKKTRFCPLLTVPVAVLFPASGSKHRTSCFGPGRKYPLGDRRSGPLRLRANKPWKGRIRKPDAPSPFSERKRAKQTIRPARLFSLPLSFEPAKESGIKGRKINNEICLFLEAKTKR